MEVVRETLNTDILIVGAGPSGLAVAYKLAQLFAVEGAPERPEILLMEKGSYVGAHSLSGAVMDPRGLAELIPDFKERGAALEAEVRRDSLYFLRETGATRIPFVPPPLKNHGNIIISLNKLVAWLGEQVEATGVDILAGLAGYELLVEDGRVVGVQTVDMGLDKDGNRKSNFEPGSLIKAKVTILCEGVHGSLTKQAFDKIPELRKDCLPQSYLAGVKEVWEIPAGRISAGDVIHTVGWPSATRDYGGSWIYGMADTMVSIGYTVGLNNPNPTTDPHHKFHYYKSHKMVRSILEGGTMLHYGAKAIPVGGYYAIPKLYHNGLLLCGDSAGMLNPQKFKGIHLAIKSGILAAETVFEAVKADSFGSEQLQLYADRFEQSWARKELYAARNFHSGFQGGLFAGMFHAGLQLLTGGGGLFNRRENKSDHEYVMTLADFEKKFGYKPQKPALKFDNQYLFDKVSDVYKSGTMHEEHQPSHLVILDSDICNTRCGEEYGNPCQHFCPASVYNMVEDEAHPGRLKLELTPSNCVHCKTCDILDPYQIIRWDTPQGGEGPNYTNC